MEKENDKLKFVVGWSSCFFVLLLMIVLGVNSSIKGTAAEVSGCPSGYTLNSNGSCCQKGYQYAEGYCCPDGYSYFSNGWTANYAGCFKVQLDGWEFYPNTNTCLLEGTLEEVADCYSTDYHDPVGVISCAYVNEDGECVDTTTESCYSCDDGWKWGTATSYSNCSLEPLYTTEGLCLVNNTGGYGCVAGLSSIYPITKYEWTNDGRISGTVNYTYIAEAQDEAQCLSNNKCYKSTSGNTYYWGWIFNSSANGWEEVNSITNETSCLDNNYTKVEEPDATLCKTELVYNESNQQITTVTEGEGYTLSNYNQTNAGDHTVTATLKYGYVWDDNTTSDATFKCNIAQAESIVSVTPDSISVNVGEKFKISMYAENIGGTFKISNPKETFEDVVVEKGKTGEKILTAEAAGSSTFTVTFTPDDETNYESFVKEIPFEYKAVSGTGGETTPTEYTYNAIFNVGSGATLNGEDTLTCKSTSSSSCTLGSSYSIPTATKSGHTFTGWDIDTSCSSPSKSNLKMTSKTVNYYACFTEDSSSGGNNDEDDDSSSGNNNGGTSVDEDGNVTEYSPTGDIIIAVIWFMGIFALAYAVVNFRNLKDN